MIFIIILVILLTFLLTLLIDRWFVEYFLVRTASKNHPFIPNKFIVPPNLMISLQKSLQNEKCLDWFNVILARYWLEISRSYGYKERIKRQIYRKLGPLKKYVNEIVVEDLDIPHESLILKEIRIITRDQVCRLEDHLKKNGLFKPEDLAEKEQKQQNSSKFNSKLDEILGDPFLQDDLSQIFYVARVSHGAMFTFNIRAHICTVVDDRLFPFKFNNTGIDKRSDLVFKSKISFGNYGGQVLVRLPGNNTRCKWEVSFLENPNFEVQAEAYLLKNGDKEEILEELNIISANDLSMAVCGNGKDQINVLGDIESSDAHLDLTLEDKKIGKTFFSNFMRRFVEKGIKKRIIYPHFHKMPLPGVNSTLKAVDHQISCFDIANHKEWANTVKNNLLLYTCMSYRIKQSNENVLMRKNAYFINGNHDRIGCVEIDFRRPDQKELRHTMAGGSQKRTIQAENQVDEKQKTPNKHIIVDSTHSLDSYSNGFNINSKRKKNYLRDEDLAVLFDKKHPSDQDCLKEGSRSDVSSLESKYFGSSDPSDSICFDDSKEGSVAGASILLEDADSQEDGYRTPGDLGDSSDSGLGAPFQDDTVSLFESKNSASLSPKIQTVFEKVISQGLNRNGFTSTESTSTDSETSKKVPLVEEIKQVLGNCEDVSTSSDQEFINGIPRYMKAIPSDDHNTRAVLSYFYNLSIFDTIFPDFSHLMEIKTFDRSVSLMKMYFHGKSDQIDTVQDYIRIVSENSIILQRNCIKEPEFLIFRFIDGKLEIYYYFLRLQFNIEDANRLRKKILQGNVEDRSGKEQFCTNVRKFLDSLDSIQTQITPSISNRNDQRPFHERKKQYEREGVLLKYRRLISISATQKNLRSLLSDPYLRLRILRENMKIVDTQRITENITSYKIKDIKTDQNYVATESLDKFGKSPTIEILSYCEKNQFIDYDVSSGHVCAFSICLKETKTKNDDLNTDNAVEPDKNNLLFDRRAVSTFFPYGDENIRNYLTILTNFQSSLAMKRSFITPLMILKQFVPLGKKSESTFVYNKSIKYIIKKPAGLLHLKLESEISDQFYMSMKINNKTILREVKVVLGLLKMSVTLQKPDNAISILIQPKTPRDKKLYLQTHFHNKNVRPVYIKDNLDEEQMVFVSKNVLNSLRKDSQSVSEHSKSDEHPAYTIFGKGVSDKEDSHGATNDIQSYSERECPTHDHLYENKHDFKFLFECTTILANQKSFEVNLVAQDRIDNIFWDVSPDNNLTVVLKNGRVKTSVSFQGNRIRYPEDPLKINVRNTYGKRLIRYRVGIISNIIK